MTAMTTSRVNLISNVKNAMAAAYDSYHWVIETHEDSELDELIGKARTLDGALKKCRDHSRMMDAARAETMDPEAPKVEQMYDLVTPGYISGSYAYSTTAVAGKERWFDIRKNDCWVEGDNLIARLTARDAKKRGLPLDTLVEVTATPAAPLMITDQTELVA